MFNRSGIGRRSRSVAISERLEDRRLLVAVQPELLADLGTRSMEYAKAVQFDKGTLAVTQYFDERPALWWTDGTQKGTRRIGRPFGEAQSIESLWPAGDKVFVVGKVDELRGLWVTDGTVSGTRNLLMYTSSNVSFGTISTSNGRAWWMPNDRPYSYPQPSSSTLWTSDGTLEGTKVAGRLTGAPYQTWSLGDVGFAVTSTGVWRSDGKNSRSGKLVLAADGPRETSIVNGSIYVRVERSGSQSAQLHRVDADGATTRLGDWNIGVMDAVLNGKRLVMASPGTEVNNGFQEWGLYELKGNSFELVKRHTDMAHPDAWTIHKGQLYFTADARLWRTDGTDDGTRSLGQWGQYHLGVDSFGDDLVITGNSSNGDTAWRVNDDGTATLVDQGMQYPDDGPTSYRSQFTRAGKDRFVYFGLNRLGQLELVAGDAKGSLQPTRLFGVAIDDYSESDPRNFTRVGDRVVFSTFQFSDSSRGHQRTTLWQVGDDRRPVPVLTLRAGSSQYAEASIRAVDDHRVLWRAYVREPESDYTYGAEAMRMYLVDLRTGEVTKLPVGAGSELMGVATDGRLYFGERTDQNYTEVGNVWRSDGTPGGTQLLTQYRLKYASSTLYGIQGVVVDNAAVYLVDGPAGNVVIDTGVKGGRLTVSLTPAGRFRGAVSEPVLFQGAVYLSYFTGADKFLTTDLRHHVVRLNLDGSTVPLFEGDAYREAAQLFVTRDAFWFANISPPKRGSEQSIITVYRSTGTARGTRRIGSMNSNGTLKGISDSQGLILAFDTYDDGFVYESSTGRIDAVPFDYRWAGGAVGYDAAAVVVEPDAAELNGWAIFQGGTLFNDTDTLVPGEPYAGFLGATIRGAVFADADADGVRDSSETGLPGVPVFIDSNGDGVFNSREPNMLTDSIGRYAFAQLSPGTYEVRAISKGLTTAVAKATLKGNQARVRDFGVRQGGQLRVDFYQDYNRNGSLDTTEDNWFYYNPIKFQVFIDDNANGLLDAGEVWTVLTNEGGSFYGLSRGTHTVRAVVPKEAKSTTPLTVSKSVPKTGTRNALFGFFTPYS